MPRDRSKPWVDVLLWGDNIATVRKMTFRDDEKVAAKYGLNTTGKWVLVPEATAYPDECILSVMFYGEEEDA